LKDEAQALLAEYQRKQRDAMREAEEIISNARGLAQRQIKDAGKKLEENLARREKASLEKIAQAEAQALAEVRREAVDVATAAAAQVIRGQIDGTRSSALIDQAIVEVEKKLH
jgi:F-type H+-transporting ATPase subunit b